VARQIAVGADVPVDPPRRIPLFARSLTDSAAVRPCARATPELLPGSALERKK
jgi:hypothetical protein